MAVPKSASRLHRRLAASGYTTSRLHRRLAASGYTTTVWRYQRVRADFIGGWQHQDTRQQYGGTKECEPTSSEAGSIRIHDNSMAVPKSASRLHRRLAASGYTTTVWRYQRVRADFIGGWQHQDTRQQYGGTKECEPTSSEAGSIRIHDNSMAVPKSASRLHRRLAASGYTTTVWRYQRVRADFIGGWQHQDTRQQYGGTKECEPTSSEAGSIRIHDNSMAVPKSASRLHRRLAASGYTTTVWRYQRVRAVICVCGCVRAFIHFISFITKSVQ